MAALRSVVCPEEESSKVPAVGHDAHECPKKARL